MKSAVLCLKGMPFVESGTELIVGVVVDYVVAEVLQCLVLRMDL